MLERRIRENQYEAHGLTAPPFETIRDYFRLVRPVAFEPPQTKAATPPWLFAAELEVRGSAFAFFHPLFDLLFGPVQSSYFWSTKFRMIPTQWIDDVEKRGDRDQAAAWRSENASKANRSHRKKTASEIDNLSFTHLSMLRLPSILRDCLFERKEPAVGWVRRYGPVESEIEVLLQHKNLDGMAAIIGLAREACEIGDEHRFCLCKAEIVKQLLLINSYQGCKNIGPRLTWVINDHCQNLIIRSYYRELSFGFALPESWQPHAYRDLFDR